MTKPQHIGAKIYPRQRMFPTIWLSKPEELVVAAAMKALGLTGADREEFGRKILVQYCSVVLSDQGLKDIDAIRRDLERLNHATAEVDLGALFLETVKRGKLDQQL